MRLLEPVRFGGVTARNRIMFGPHVTNLGEGRALSARHVAYYARRAAGGTGIIVTETASVHDSDWPYERAPLAARCGPGWRAVAGACRGATVIASIGHAGGQGSSAYSQRELWAPSAVPEVSSREMPKVMEPEDIAAVIDGFAAAARLAVASGLAGVEVDAGSRGLVRQFLSGLTNARSDGYGADRPRFAREVLAAVRAAIGDAALGLRLSCDELAPWAGITPEAAGPLAAGLARYADYLVVVRGSIYSAAATRPDAHTPPGFNAGLAAAVAAAAGVPVFAQGSIVDPDFAERLLGAGAVAGAEMTRALLADADLAGKLAAGAAPRPCVLCNQACQVLDARNPLVSCVGDPRSGHETADEPCEGDAERPLDFLVVGGGPCGLEAARVAAGRGHRVRLAEAARALGGNVAVAARAPGRDRLARLASWLAGECGRLGVDIVLGHRVDAAEAAAHPGPLVVATGSRDGERGYQVDGGGRVVSAQVLLAGEAAGDGAAGDGAAGDGAPGTGPFLVWDPAGGLAGVPVAELLAARGPTTLAFPDQIPGQQLSLTGDLVAANTRLQAAGVRLERRCALRRVEAAQVRLEDLFGAGERVVPAALVVDAGYRLPAPLCDPGPGVVVAGDAVAPRTVYQAVLEGRRAVLRLERAFLPAAPAGAPR